MNIMNIMNIKLLLAGCKIFLGKYAKKTLNRGICLFTFTMFIMFIRVKIAFFVAKTSFFGGFLVDRSRCLANVMKKNEYIVTILSQVGENVTGVSGQFMNIDAGFMNIADSMFIVFDAAFCRAFLSVSGGIR